MTVETLKEEARRHEQQEQWTKALETYREALSRMAGHEEPDISLYNRVGDLQLRLGDREGAIEHYDRAVDLYVEAGLPNNAIAICKKLLRNVPERDGTYLRLGQVRAEQGFVPDARQAFLTYAERKQASGDLEEAFRALVEFVELVPDDHETRRLLADHLATQERTDEAVEQYGELYRRLMEAGETEGAEEAAERARELDPDAVLPTVEPGADEGDTDEGVLPEDAVVSPDDDALSFARGPGAGAAAAPGEGEAPATGDGESPGDRAPWDDDGSVLEEEPLGTEASVEGVDDPEGGPGFEGTALEERGPLEEEPASFGGDAPAGEGEALAGRIPGDDEGADEDTAALEGFEATALEADVHEEPPADELAADPGEDDAATGEEVPAHPWLDAGTDDGEPAVEDVIAGDVDADGPVEPEEEELPALGLEPTDLPGGEPAAPEEERAAEELDGPLDGLDAPAAATPETEDPADLRARVAALRGKVDEDPADPEAWDELGDGLLRLGWEDEGQRALERAHRGFALRGELQRAIRVVRELARRRTDDVALHQQLVEYAQQADDRTLLEPAFLELARVLEEKGEADQAAGVYRKVLNLDPENEVAREALGEEEETVPDGGYVDLGSLVLDEEEEKDTRMVVPSHAPTGDEDADFARMLEQFKEKVSENLDVGDARAHYDLGTAYKEMGLVDEAIAEFQQALRADSDSLPTFEMLGQCFLEKDQPSAAIRLLERAVRVPFQVEDDLVGIYYYLGRSHEASGNPEEALEFYEKVFTLDINFKDVTDRLRELRGG